MAFQGDSIFWVEVEKIVPNPFQPRREFDEAKLKELSESVRMYGILQPLTVTRKEIQRDDGAFFTEYELIAGERRLRASRLAGLAQVPVIIREGDNSEQEKLELAIIENLQREDLNAVDRALAFRQLADAFELSHAQVAKKVGRSREYVSNTLRLLQLPEYMLDSLKIADISEGHARTLLMLNTRPEEQDTVYREILLKKLSVREVERIARKIATDKVRKKSWQDTDPGLIAIEKQFTESLGTRVQIAKTDYGGKISIDYFSEDDLQNLLERLKAERGVVAAAGAVAAVSSELEDSQQEEVELLEKLTEHTPLVNSAEAEPAASEKTAHQAVLMSEEPPVTTEANLSTSEAEPEEGVQPSVESMPAVSESLPVDVPSAQTVENQPEDQVTPESIPEPEKKEVAPATDESDLYGIKNFSL